MNVRRLLNPVYLVRRIACELYQRRHPDHPWFSPGAISWLDKHLKKDMAGWEWGSGRSTKWLSQRLNHLTSIEHDTQWLHSVRTELDRSDRKNVDLRHIPTEHEFRDLFFPYYEKEPAYVGAIKNEPSESMDLVIVDGYYRQLCVWASLPYLKPGGILVVDNTDWMIREQWPVPFDWMVAHESSNAQTQTTIWIKPTHQA